MLWRKELSAPKSSATDSLSALSETAAVPQGSNTTDVPGAPPAAGFEVLGPAPCSQRCPQGLHLHFIFTFESLLLELMKVLELVTMLKKKSYSKTKGRIFV